MSTTHSHSNRGVIIGVLMILFGSFYLIGDFFHLPFWLDDYIFAWPTIMLLVGIGFFTTQRSRGTGVVLMLIGGIFLAKRIFGDFHVDFRIVWPVVLIVGGIALLLRKKDLAQIRNGRRNKDRKGNFVEDVNIFGGGNQVVTSEEFTGGSVISVFGGGEYDLRKAELSEGTNELEVVSIFGGSSYIVPSDWEVKNEVISIFGGFSDSRKFLPTEQTDKSKVLRITGIVMFGGGEVKNI